MQLSTVDQPQHNLSKSRIVHAKVRHVSPTPPHLGVICHHRLGFIMINVCIKYEDPNFTRCGNTKGNAKCIKSEKSHMKRLAIQKRPSRTLKVIAVRQVVHHWLSGLEIWCCIGGKYIVMMTPINIRPSPYVTHRRQAPACKILPPYIAPFQRT